VEMRGGNPVAIFNCFRIIVRKRGDAREQRRTNVRATCCVDELTTNSFFLSIKNLELVHIYER
jgi:hypothetical protein